MGQCVFVKKSGEQCKANAVDGQEYCAVHLKKVLAGEVVLPPTEGGGEKNDEARSEPTKGGDMPAIHNSLKKRKIRYLGSGNYAIPSEEIVFCRAGQVEEVSHATWERLLTQPESKNVFEEA